MFISDAVFGTIIILTPFVVLGWCIIRRRRSDGVNSGEVERLNTNGLPMVGSVDVCGNPYGTTGTHITNVNGLPMVGAVDIMGNPFGDSGHTH